MKPSDFTLEVEYYIIGFGLHVKKLRQERGWTQGHLASLLHTKKQWVSRLENGEPSVRIASIIKLALVFDMDIRDFLPSSK